MNAFGLGMALTIGKIYISEITISSRSPKIKFIVEMGS